VNFLDAFEAQRDSAKVIDRYGFVGLEQWSERASGASGCRQDKNEQH